VLYTAANHHEHKITNENKIKKNMGRMGKMRGEYFQG